MSSLEGALCVGRHQLFESTDPADHAEAAELCADCPAIAACQKLLTEQATTLAGYGGGPCGTWAGQLVGTKAKAREHGTERGWGQHRHYRETVCEPCRTAHAATWRERYSPSVEACGERLVVAPRRSDNGAQETTKASRPRAIGADTPTRGLADRLETTDS